MFAFQVGIFAFITIMSQHNHFELLVSCQFCQHWLQYKSWLQENREKNNPVEFKKKLTNIPFQFINFYASLIYIAFFKVICVCLNIVNKVLVEHVCWTWLFWRNCTKRWMISMSTTYSFEYWNITDCWCIHKYIHIWQTGPVLPNAKWVQRAAAQRQRVLQPQGKTSLYIVVCSRHGICPKFYTARFSGQKFYTVNFT